MPDAGIIQENQSANDMVRAQLEGILVSSEFQVPDRTRRFLRFIVEETLAGRGHRIKGYTVATEVFGRSETFDAQTDPVVRLEAGRLRRALERYYLVAGRNDPVHIDVPKGSYVPTFEINQEARSATRTGPVEAGAAGSGPDARPWHRLALAVMSSMAFAAVAAFAAWLTVQAAARHPLAGAEHANETTLVVMPFTHLGGDEAQSLATGLTEDLMARLANIDQFGELRLLGHETTHSIAASANLAPGIEDTGARYLLNGNVQVAQNRVRLRARLLDASSGEVIWSETFDRVLDMRDVFAIQDEVADVLVTKVTRAFGIDGSRESRHGFRMPMSGNGHMTAQIRSQYARTSI